MRPANESFENNLGGKGKPDTNKFIITSSKGGENWSRVNYVPRFRTVSEK
jgi:hypothetical protein